MVVKWRWRILCYFISTVIVCRAQTKYTRPQTRGNIKYNVKSEADLGLKTFDESRGISSRDDTISLVQTNSFRFNGTSFNTYKRTLNGITVLGERVVTKLDKSNRSTGRSSEKKISSHNMRMFSPGGGRSLTAKREMTQAVLRNICGLRSVKKIPDAKATYRAEEKFLYKELDGNERLATIIMFSDPAPKKLGACLIDVHTGEVLLSWNPKAHVGTAGDGGNAKAGYWTFGSDSDSKFPLLPTTQVGAECIYRTPHIQVFHAESQDPSLGTWTENDAFRVTCGEKSNDAVNGAKSPTNDIFFAASKWVELMSRELGLTKWTPGSKPLQLITHAYAFDSSGANNAYWDPVDQHVVFGTGGKPLYPLMCHDIAYHEMQHVFTDAYSELIYSRESGCVNEAISDMAAVAGVAFESGKEPTHWGIGGGCSKGEGALRYMDDPTKDGMSIKHYSDYFSGMDVHDCSGIYNHAFYNLVAVQGMGTLRAYTAFALANVGQWTQLTTMQSGACDVLIIAAAVEYSEAELAKIGAAFEKVGISTTSCGGVEEGPTKLENGKAVTDVGAAKGAYLHYTIEVNYDGESAHSLTVETVGPEEGDFDMYVQYQRQASETDFKEKSVYWGNEETVVIYPLKKGVYHVTLKAFSATAGVTLKATFVPLKAHALSDCTEVTVPTTTKSSSTFYSYILSGTASKVTITTTGGTGDPDVFIELDKLPNTSEARWKSTSTGTDEKVLIIEAVAGIYYISVHAYEAFEGVKLTACTENGVTTATTKPQSTQSTTPKISTQSLSTATQSSTASVTPLSTLSPTTPSTEITATPTTSTTATEMTTPTTKPTTKTSRRPKTTITTTTTTTSTTTPKLCTYKIGGRCCRLVSLPNSQSTLECDVSTATTSSRSVTQTTTQTWTIPEIVGEIVGGIISGAASPQFTCLFIYSMFVSCFIF